jgi:hypothetical protein
MTAPERPVLALSGTGHPASAHAADGDAIGAHGMAWALCRSSLAVSVDHTSGGAPVVALPLGGERVDGAEWVSCLRCSRILGVSRERDTPGIQPD